MKMLIKLDGLIRKTVPLSDSILDGLIVILQSSIPVGSMPMKQSRLNKSQIAIMFLIPTVFLGISSTLGGDKELIKSYVFIPISILYFVFSGSVLGVAMSVLKIPLQLPYRNSGDSGLTLYLSFCFWSLPAFITYVVFFFPDARSGVPVDNAYNYTIATVAACSAVFVAFLIKSVLKSRILIRSAAVLLVAGFLSHIYIIVSIYLYNDVKNLYLEKYILSILKPLFSAT